MDESEDNISSVDIKFMINPCLSKIKPKKRSLVERELETSLTARITSPKTNSDGASTSRYGRTRRHKADGDYIDTEKCIKIMDSPTYEKTPVKMQSPVYKMHASNSPIKLEPKETPIKSSDIDSSLNNQIENIYSENISLSRFSSEEKKNKTPRNKLPKVYVRKDLIQSREKDEYVMLIKNMFSPPKSARKSNSHLNNILERSSEKYGLNTSTEKLKPHNGFSNNASVVKTLDFDSNKKKREEKDGKVLSQSDLFHLEAKCEYQVGDLAWARMGTYPFWPCIVTREPSSGMFVKKKLFGRIEHDIIHVTFFGDNGRRGWIVDTMLRRFLGQLEFEATRESFAPSAKKKDPRLYAAFFVSEKTMPRWTISVEEAETLLREPKRLRIDILYDMLAKTRSGKSTPKQQKSGKIARTASAVESDVSLSESLYDTLFSEDDGKSEDTERSRSKTRLSLDVSEVVTACLDNMAAKSGITKIQRQSHMDRWLQKAKSNTPEKSQANLPPPKEKETKSTSAKKNKVAPTMVPIKKPYCLRKSSYEPQVLKSNDNEHDYSTKISSDTSQTCIDVQANANYDISFEVKVELLQDKPGVEDTEGDKTTHNDTTDSEVVKAADSGDTLHENTNQNIQIDLTEEEGSEIQENICSIEENEELLLGQTENPVEAKTVISSSADSESQSEIVKIFDAQNSNDFQQVQMKNQVDEASVEINKEPEKPMKVEELVVAMKFESGHKTEDKTIEAHTTAEKSRETDKKVAISQTPEMQPKKSSRIINKVKQAVTNSPEFVKYLELRQDALMDEHPELSQKEIEEYLYKTWQYEESAKYDFKSPEEVTPKATFGSKNRNRNSRNRSKKRVEDALPRNILFSNSSTKTNVQAQLNSPSTSKDTTEIKSSFSKDSNSTVKEIKGISKLTETSPESSQKPVDSTKIFENKTDKAKNNSTPIVPSTSGRKSLSLLRSPAISKYPQEMSSKSKTAENTQSGADPKSEITIQLEEEVDAPKSSSSDVDKVNIDTTPIASTSGRRSLRNRLSRSPATPKDSKKVISTEISIKTVENKNVEPELAVKQPETTPKLDKQSINSPKRADEKVDKEREKSVRKSLRTRTSKSPASTKCIIENKNNKSEESNTVKLPECNQIVIEHCYTDKLPDMKSDALTTETSDESNIDKLKIETKPVKNDNSVKRSVRVQLSRHINATTSNINKEITLSKSTESIHTESKHADNTPNIDEQIDDSPKLSEVKEQIKSPLVADASVRRSRRTKLIMSLAMTVDKNESTSVNKDCNLQTNETVQTITALTEQEPEITQNIHEHSAKSNKSENNIEENKLSVVSTENQNETSQVANKLESLNENEEKNDKDEESGITSKVKDKDLTTESQIEVELEIPREIEEEMIETVTRLSKDPKEQEGSTLGMDVSMKTEQHTNMDQATEPKINLEKDIGVTQIAVRKDSTLGMDDNVNTEERTNKIQVTEHEINIEKAIDVPQIAVQIASTLGMDDDVNTEEHTNKIQVTEHKIVIEKAIDIPQIAVQKDSTLGMDDNMNTKEQTKKIQETEPTINLEKAIDVTGIAVQKDSTLGTDNTMNTEEQTKTIQETEPKINVEKSIDVTEIAVQKDSTLGIDGNINTEEHTNKIQETKPKINSEKAIDVIQIAAENYLKTEDQTDSILNTDDHDKGEKTSIDISVLTETSCAEPTMETTQAETSKIVQTEQTHTDSEMPTVTKTVNRHDTKIQNIEAIKNDEQIIDKEKPIENIEVHKTDKQVEIHELIQKQAVNDQVKDDVPDEDKEYGHLDFVFSVLDEKFKALNDINKTVIEKNVSNTDSISIEKAKSIHITHSEGNASNNIKSKCNTIKTNIDTFESHVDKLVDPSIEKVQINHKEMNVEEFVKFKYEKLYNSCTALKVKVERLPRLSSKVIKMKDLDKEIALSTTRLKRFKKKSLKLNSKVPVFNEKEFENRIANDRDETCIENTKMNIKNIVEKSQVNGYISDHSIEINHYKKEDLSQNKQHNNVKNKTNKDCRDSTDEKVLHTVEVRDKSKYLSENKNGKDSIVYITNKTEQNGNATVAKISVESEPIDISKDKKNIQNTRVIKEDIIKNDSKEVFNGVSHAHHKDQIYPHLNAQPQTLLPKENVEYSRNKSDFYTVGTESETVKVLQVKPCHIANENILPKVDFRPVPVAKPGIPDQIRPRPSALSNGYDYLYDDEDDEEEFESPAFSPIFKEPIEPEQKDNKDELDKKDNQDDSKKPEAVIEKTDTNSSDNSLSKDDSLKPSVQKEDVMIPTENKTQEVITNNDVTALMEEKNAKNVKDELMTSVSRLPEPVKINGYHLDEYGLDCSDNDFNVETSSINSEDSEPLSVTKNKLVSKNRKKAKKALEDVEFVKYLELKQDALMDEHPELDQDEIVEYLYKTWQYEESLKSDVRKNDDIEQAVLVKGLNDDLRQKSMKNRYRENKKRRKKVDDDALSISSNASKKEDEDTISIDSDVSDMSTRRRLRSRFSNSPAITVDENEVSVSKESSPERKLDLKDKSLDSDDFIKLTKRKVRNQILDDSLDDEDFPKVKEESSKDDSTKYAKREESRPKRTNESNKSPKTHKETKIKKYFEVINSVKETKITIRISDTNEQETKVNEIKEESDPDTVSITSINSEDSEVSLSKRKQRKDKQSIKPMEEPEFLNYVEMRQDVLIDENPQLTHEEIIAYLYKTWLYEESVKSDLKKSDEIEQANLVKGLNSDVVQPKKVRKKTKTEKALAIEEAAKEKQEKPKRKTYQPYYNEDTISDIEDEIELFEIFRTKKKKSVDVKSELISEAEKDTDVTSTVTKEESDQDVIDEVELYFEQLTKPKPNVFKGLVREKVCEICEKTGNLVKCKGCCGMFHVECQLKPKEEGVVSTKGRKKKKKLGRRPKNLDDSGSHSDEKSQDVSEEHNASIEEEPEPIVVDEAVFEAALTAKMKEIFPTIDLTYDAYPSDIALDWNTRPGQCEIVNVKMEPKIDDTDFKCGNCQIYSTPVCFVCKEAVSKTGVHHRQKCHTNHCNKYYHLECLDHWPQTQFNTGELCKKKNNEHDTVVCPRHVCHTCVSDDPRGCRTRFSGDKLARCVRCPATYHSFTKCLPAGTQILTGSLIVCPRHYEHRPGKVPCHVNTGWCFICALGGSLICCEYCPTSFHAECLNIKPPEGGYMCEDCETGRLPLYGEMVWVKLGHYRWWPGIILHPSEIPENILAVKHSQGEFVVRFFGQYDHYWVNRGRVFPFQEGDSGRISTQKSKIDSDFITAMEHAHRAFEILKNAQPNDEESNDIASSLLPPHYVKLKVNKPCGSLIGRRPDVEESSLTQCECDPMVEDPCGPYSHCLNRMLLTECGPICRAGDRCNNRAFEKRLYPKMVPYRTSHRGWGLKTLENIRAGQFVIEYVGELIDEEEFRRRMNWMHEIRDENFYFLTLDKERMIDAGPKGNLARFMNHCCEPNCETQKWTVLGDVRVGLFAINDIPANSELTFNYNLECTGIEKKRCMCGAKRCSGYIGAKPKQIEETQPKKKRVYKKRAKPVDESPSTSKNKPKRPVGRPPKPRELTEIEKDLLIIKSATNDISSDSETSSRLGSIDNPNPKALKRKRVSFSTEESLCSSPSSKKSKDNSPSTKKETDEFTSPNSLSTKPRIDEFISPSTKDKIDVCVTPSTKKVKLEDSKNEPSAKRLKLDEKSEVGD